MGKPGLRKVHRYSTEFKLTAVKLSSMPGVQVQTVADALDIHPFVTPAGSSGGAWDRPRMPG
jgi:transposase